MIRSHYVAALRHIARPTALSIVTIALVITFISIRAQEADLFSVHPISRRVTEFPCNSNIY